MPRYNYQCSKCDSYHVIFHLVDEEPPPCPECSASGTLIKQLGVPYFKVTDNTSKTQKIGELTKEYIELNKEILKEQKEKREEYDET